jgi:hypothetical protein
VARGDDRSTGLDVGRTPVKRDRVDADLARVGCFAEGKQASVDVEKMARETKADALVRMTR